MRHTVRLFPRASSTDTQTNPRRPRSPLEQEHREDNTKRKTQGGLDDHRGDGAVPLNNSPCISHQLPSVCVIAAVLLGKVAPTMRQLSLLRSKEKYLLVQQSFADGFGGPGDRRDRPGLVGIGHCGGSEEMAVRDNLPPDFVQLE